MAAHRCGREAGGQPAGVGAVEVLGTELGEPDVAKLGDHGLGAGAVPADRARLAEESDVLEPALEQLSNRNWSLKGCGSVLDLDHEAAQLGLSLALAALHITPDLYRLALLVSAQVDPQLPRSWATLSNGAFACRVLFLVFLVLQRVPTPRGL